MEIYTFGDLVLYRKRDVKFLKGIGNKAIQNLEDHLSYFGIKWK
jgi:hypothetical protein